jgi:Flp pilus assembly protein TadG
VKRESRQSSYRFGSRFGWMRALIADFRKNTRANIAIIMAAAAVPVISAVGCVVDYTLAMTVRTKLQSGADSATLAAVSVNSPLVKAAQAMGASNGPVTNGSTYLQDFFNANASTVLNSQTTTAGTPYQITASSVTKSGRILTATVSYTAQAPTSFLKIMGKSNIALGGTSTSSYTLPTYIDFYLLLDVSGSMSFPSTAAEQARLQAVNPDNMNPPSGGNGYPGGCTFACHFSTQGACPQSGSGAGPYQGPIPAVGKPSNPSPGGYCQGFLITRLGTTPTSFTPNTNNATNGNHVNWSNTPVTNCPTDGTNACIQLRADAVGYAVNQLLSTAASTEQATGVTSPPQFRVGLYPFIVHLYNSGHSDGSGYANLTGSITGSSTSPGTINYAAANLATLLDTGNNAALGSGGTHFENALTTINTVITSVGTGTSSTDTLPYVFLVTDGSQDNQTQWAGSWSGSNHATTIDTANCTTLKNRGITVAVLYIPYQTIQNPTTFANSEDIYANNNIPNIPGALQSCASPNFFYTADSPADINNALIQMFQQAVSTAHVTN